MTAEPTLSVVATGALATAVSVDGGPSEMDLFVAALDADGAVPALSRALATGATLVFCVGATPAWHDSPGARCGRSRREEPVQERGVEARGAVAQCRGGQGLLVEGHQVRRTGGDADASGQRAGDGNRAHAQACCVCGVWCVVCRFVFVAHVCVVCGVWFVCVCASESTWPRASFERDKGTSRETSLSLSLSLTHAHSLYFSLCDSYTCFQNRRYG